MSLYEDKEKDVLEHIKNHDEESRKSLKNHEWTEKTAVKAFLRKCGIKFKDGELIPIHQGLQPPDVRFRDANFEVTEVLDEGRRRDDEYKEKIKQGWQATSSADLLNSTPMEFPVLLMEIEKGMDNKFNKYNNPNICKKFDLLVYVNLEKRHLIPLRTVNGSSEFLTKVEKQGWRSVSFLTKSYGGVIFCLGDAPDFLKSLNGLIRSGNWNDFEN
ncbi:hypothetical protein ES703_121228 [subsurface metagenome]